MPTCLLAYRPTSSHGMFRVDFLKQIDVSIQQKVCLIEIFCFKINAFLRNQVNFDGDVENFLCRRVIISTHPSAPHFYQKQIWQTGRAE